MPTSNDTSPAQSYAQPSIEKFPCRCINIVKSDTIIQFPHKFHVDQMLIDWIAHMLRNKWKNCVKNNNNTKGELRLLHKAYHISSFCVE